MFLTHIDVSLSLSFTLFLYLSISLSLSLKSMDTFLGKDEKKELMGKKE